jgi:Zn-dependent peptidase ImmA (M78 family)/transcriptional regulator with XRE-family HTH domain
MDELNVNSLKYAREYLNLSLEEVTKKTGFKNLSDWECGMKLPTNKQLEKLAKYYNRSYFFFFNTELPTNEKIFADFRNKDYSKDFSKNAILAINTAKENRINYIELATELSVDIPNFVNLSFNSFSIKDDASKIANDFRKKININDEYIKSKKNAIEKSIYIKSLIENTGVLIFESNTHPSYQFDDFRGCALYFEGYLPIILLNGKESNSGKIFTMFHEFAHLLLKHTSYNKDVLYEKEKEEVWCNKFAANILMPKNLVDSKFKNIKPNNLYKNIQALATEFSVSFEAFLIRLVNLNLINTTEFNELKDKYQQTNNKKTSGIKSYDIDCIKRNGKPYLSLVIEAIHADIIHKKHWGSYTKLNPIRYIGDIEERLFNNA